MPKTLMAVPDTQPSIVRPIAKQVMAYLVNKLALPSDINIQLLGDSAELANDAFDLTCKDERVRFSPEARVQLSFREVEGSAQPVYSTYTMTNYPPFFFDPYRNLSVNVVRDQVKMEFELDITFPTRVEALRVYELLKTYAYTMEAEDTHTFEYSYTIPENVTLLLLEAHRKISSSKAPEFEVFRDYFDRYKLQATEVLSKVVGGQDHFAIHEKQHEVLGWFDFTTPPTPQSAGDGTGNYRVALTYSVTYSKPIQFFVKWPLLINQQLIDGIYIPNRVTHYPEIDVHTSYSKEALDYIAYQCPKSPPYLILPEIDDWYLPPQTRNGLYFFSCLFKVDDDGKASVDLRDLGEWSFSKYMLEYIGHLGDRAYSDDSIVTMEVYEGNERIYPKYTVKKGVLYFSDTLDIRQDHHVRIGLKLEWKSINTDTTEGLRRYPTFFKEILEFFGVYNLVANDVGFVIIGGNHPRPFNPSYPGEGYNTGELNFDPTNPLSPLNPNCPYYYLNPDSPYYYLNPGSPFYGINIDEPLSPFNPGSIYYYLNPDSPYYYKREDSPFHNPNPNDPFWSDYGYNWIYKFMDWNDLGGIVAKKTLESAKEYLDKHSNDFTKEQSGIMALVLYSHLITRNVKELTT